jgi:hypothetical protein
MRNRSLARCFDIAGNDAAVRLRSFATGQAPPDRRRPWRVDQVAPADHALTSV